MFDSFFHGIVLLPMYLGYGSGLWIRAYLLIALCSRYLFGGFHDLLFVLIALCCFVWVGLMICFVGCVFCCLLVGKLLCCVVTLF